MQRTTHPNICICHDYHVWPDGKLGGLLLEFIEGGTLRERLDTAADSGRKLGQRATLALAKQMLAALAHMHSESYLIHRDVKPDNIMASATLDGGGTVWKLVDFGLAVAQQGASASDTFQTGTMSLKMPKGTMLFMSPEQEKGYLDKLWLDAQRQP